MRKVLTVLAATLASLGLAVATAPAAHGDTLGRVTVHLVKRADNGHGQPAHWADDTFDRTATITPGDADGTYTVTLSGKGSFVTVDGAGAPNGGGGKVTGGVNGDMTESLTAAVTSQAGPKNARVLGNIDGATISGKAKRAAAQEFIKRLFKHNAATVKTTAYRYVYSTGCEKWTDANDNNDGQADDAGTITGKDCTPATPVRHPSKLVAANKCRISKSDKRNYWTVSNVAGPRTRTFWIHVSYGGKTTYEGAHTVAAGDHISFLTSHGGKLRVGYYDGYAHHKNVFAWSNAKTLC